MTIRRDTMKEDTYRIVIKAGSEPLRKNTEYLTKALHGFSEQSFIENEGGLWLSPLLLGRCHYAEYADE